MSRKPLLLAKTRVFVNNSTDRLQSARSDSASCASEHSFTSELDSYINSQLNGASSEEDGDDSLTQFIGSHRENHSRSNTSTKVIEARFLVEKTQDHRAASAQHIKLDEAEDSVRLCSPVAHPYSDQHSLPGDDRQRQSPHLSGTLDKPESLPMNRLANSNPSYSSRVDSPSQAIHLLLGQLRADAEDTCSPLPPDLLHADTSSHSSSSSVLSPASHHSHHRKVRSPCSPPPSSRR